MAAVTAAAAVAAVGYSAYSGERQYKSAMKSASKARKASSAAHREEGKRYQESIGMYRADLARQEQYEGRAYESAMEDWEKRQKTTRTQYETQMQDYTETVESLEGWKQNWADMAEDPRSHHPGWPSFETAITEAAESQMEQLGDIYQRRGKAESGEYMRAMSEIEGTRQESLQDALMGITREARGKMYEIDAARPQRPMMPLSTMAKPVLGGAQQTMPMPQFAAPGSSYIPSPVGAVGDIQGLGQSLAYAMDKMKNVEDPKVAPTSTLSELDTGVGASTQWAIPGAAEQYESMFGEAMMPQQTEYSLLS